MPQRVSPIRISLARHLASINALADSAEVIEQMARTLQRALEADRTILTCGNGGSAAEALHLAEEMIGRFSRDRAPIAALSLSADPTALTCIANDYGFEAIFARQVEGLGRPGDILVALSTSGRSPNIVKALRTARGLGLTTIGLLGPAGSPAQRYCDLALTLSAGASAHVQEMHLITIHLLLEHLDARLRPRRRPAARTRQ